MIVVVLLYAVCWLPLHALQLAIDENPDLFIEVKNLRHIWISFQMFSASHSCYNPFVYFWMNRRFRKCFRAFFLKCFCCLRMGRFKYGDNQLSRQASITMTVRLGRQHSRLLSAKRNDSVWDEMLTFLYGTLFFRVVDLKKKAKKKTKPCMHGLRGMWNNYENPTIILLDISQEFVVLLGVYGIIHI